jgi:hypothetical protein
MNNGEYFQCSVTIDFALYNTEDPEDAKYIVERAKNLIKSYFADDVKITNFTIK